MNKHGVASLFFFGAVAFCIYSKILFFDFVWDDHSFLVNNPFLDPPQKLASFFKNPFAFAPDTDAQIYRPLRNLAWYGLVCAFGKNSFYFHSFQLTLHVLNSFLIFIFLLRILSLPRWAGLAGGLLFLIHPLQTEAVCWIKSTDDVLCVFFGLSGLLLLIPGIRRESAGVLLFSFSLLFCSMLSKESGVFLVFIYAFFILLELKQYKKFFLSLLFIISVGYLFLRTYVLGQLSQVEPLTGNWFTTQLGMAAVYLEYFFKILIPVNQHVNYMGFSPFIPYSLWELGGLWVALILLVLLFFKRSPKIRIWFFALFFSFLPVSNIIPMMQWGAERFLYFPMAFIVIIISFYLSRLKKVYWAFLFTLYLLLLAGANMQRQSIWENNATLGEAMLQSNSASYHGLFLTLEAYKKQERWEDLILIGEKYLYLYPDQENIYEYVSYAYIRNKQVLRAYEIIIQGLARFPENSLLVRFRDFLNPGKKNEVEK